MALKRVLVVGGGSAGWITAAYLDAVLNGKTAKAVDITVIESPDIGRIGVGEATVPSVRDTMASIGADERTFMKAADATFKQAIKFVNWLDGAGEHYYHPFDRRQKGRLDRSGLRWMTSDRSTPFAHTVSAQPWLADDGRSAKPKGAQDYQSPLSYAYHMDAEKTAGFLCDLAVGRGVKHVLDLVVDVEMAPHGDIAAVKTKSGERLEADLFIDCTGFRALLIEGALKAGYEDYSDYLMCDRAVAMRVPYDAHWPGARKAYTTATALSSGWCWDIGLASRRGVGYVYSSRFIDDDAAEAELRAFEGPHSDDIAARTLKFRTGRRIQPWTRNCVAIGLSSGFIEPLESTGLFLVELSAATLAEYFPFGGEMQPLADRFNAIIDQRYEEILDFVVLHYCITRRTDTAFWREVSKPNRIPDRLASWLETWKLKSPSHSDFHDSLQLFSHHTYEYVLYGMDHGRERIANIDPARLPATPVPRDVQGAVAQGRRVLPSHDDWLRAELGEAYAPPA
ncbi:MAG: tryptophan halogenase family protein [Pseudomonadota bacterium]